MKEIFKLIDKERRGNALRAVSAAPEGYVVTIAEPTRNLDQNARLWAMLDDIAKAEPMGRKHTPEEWKAIFCQAAGWEMAFLPGLSGGFFPVGFRTSKMTVRQMADLITWVQAWADEQGVQFSEPNPYERGAA